MQLMQPYVQKSRSTTLPLSAASDSGLSVLSQPRPPVNSGARMRVFSWADMVEPFLELALVERERKQVVATATIQTSEIRRRIWFLFFKVVDRRGFFLS